MSAGNGSAPRDPEEGRIALLSLGFALVAMVLVLVVVSASAVHLQRKRLYALADAAAADAADAVDERAYYAAGGVRGETVPLSDATVRTSVRRYLLLAGAEQDLPGVVVAAGTGSPDGVSADVVLDVVVVPPFAAFVPGPFADGVELRAASSARTSLR